MGRVGRQRGHSAWGHAAVYRVVADPGDYLPHWLCRGPIVAMGQRASAASVLLPARGCSFITLVATGVSALGSHGVDILLSVDSTLIVVGGIILLVAGMTAVGAMQDAIDLF